jgi:phage terminase large subunit
MDYAFYIREVAYSTGLLTNTISEILRDFNCPIYCDNAEPRLIAELNLALKRNNVFGVKYELLPSIQLIQQQKIYLLNNAKNTIEEHQNYMFKRNKATGELTNEPTGKDHAMDAIRYGLMGFMTNRGKGIYQRTF